MVAYDWRTCPPPDIAPVMGDYGPLGSDIGPRPAMGYGPSYRGGPFIDAGMCPERSLLPLLFAGAVGLVLGRGMKGRRKRK